LSANEYLQTIPLHKYQVFIVQAYQTSGGLSVCRLGTLGGISRQTEGHSFSDHLISGPASVAPSSFTEASLYNALCSVFMACVRYNLEQRVFIFDCYVEKKTQIMQEKISP
jgi:hypothetical protein